MAHRATHGPPAQRWQVEIGRRLCRRSGQWTAPRATLHTKRRLLVDMLIPMRPMWKANVQSRPLLLKRSFLRLCGKRLAFCPASCSSCRQAYSSHPERHFYNMFCGSFQPDTRSHHQGHPPSTCARACLLLLPRCGCILLARISVVGCTGHRAAWAHDGPDCPGYPEQCLLSAMHAPEKSIFAFVKHAVFQSLAL